ncbi:MULTISPECIES: class I SAM-dependent methyltransferase [Salimicrobium]|uniref:16S rRNA (Cytosine(1402)-N(4))-methyltransferase n=3 Tax=Salimicrobium TaxID=351195 RepID=K2GRT2_9BACI|nr:MULTISPECIES: class I SAM-dependent methyltransferase [Salimicrobium]AKG04054.1 16S rRNA (cytosine(1402)-N(4))-methyltransferase [Salimicrobium jeotgali]EKE33104.1 rRNA methylase YtqB [Salimicrobium jeotgali]MBM7694901.1 16S rRNA C1402 N4-methylase RsmH [Salimicrobium jeotgali]SDY03292.1 Putative rRNA methylase [Salimicrobium album]SIS73095.1 Putative rRNA methylase [Salimicrobium salexigens]
MNLDRVLPFSHELMKKAVTEGDIAIDATCGNGHDTLFLASLTKESGHVYGFDIQKDAIEATAARLKENNSVHQVTLNEASHAEALKYIPEERHPNIRGAIFNLGFLPGSDKTVVTTPEHTIEAIDNILSVMEKGGLVVLVVYHGHEGGKKEKEKVMEYAGNLDQRSVHVLKYEFLNQKNNAPFIVALEKA